MSYSEPFRSRSTIYDNAQSRRVPFRMLRRMSLGFVKWVQPLIPQKLYMRTMVHLLRSYGINFVGIPIYISPTCWFDGADYRQITIGHNVVISSNVNVLTHDFSISRVRDAISGQRVLPEIALIRGVIIGENSFVGRGAILMPGSQIGRNCIIGAGAVVRGEIPDNSIVLGNPAQIVGDSLEWGARKLQEMRI